MKLKSFIYDFLDNTYQNMQKKLNKKLRGLTLETTGFKVMQNSAQLQKGMEQDEGYTTANNNL